ncbi:MAG TPA: hypothetical protein VJM32_04570 [Candidatus Saccharimonadales bacterium]|nr:hypothetical protein [Candidatus Saccharimonadales bacterium]
MQSYTSPQHFRRACVLAAFEDRFRASVALLDEWVCVWQYVFRRPLARLVQMAERALTESESLGANIARVRLQSEIIGLPETDSLHTIMQDVTPIREVFMGEDFNPDEFVALLQLVIETFKTEPEVTL